MKHRLVAWIACVIIAAVATDFISAIKDYHEANTELTPIQVKTRKPMTMMQILISQCPNRLGELQTFLDCREEIVLQYREQEVVTE